jgi:hypothetical protein
MKYVVASAISALALSQKASFKLISAGTAAAERENSAKAEMADLNGVKAVA